MPFRFQLDRRIVSVAGLAVLFALSAFAGCRSKVQSSLLSAQFPSQGLSAHARSTVSRVVVESNAAQLSPVSYQPTEAEYLVTGIGPLGESSYATAISGRGSVVGACQTSRGGIAFLWSQGNMRRLGKFSVYDINSRGQVVGFKETGAGQEQPLLMNKGHTTLLGMLPGATSTYGYRINDHGQVVENALAGSRLQSRAFVWSGHRLWPLWTLPGFASCQAEAINSSGVVAGGATGPDGIQHACLWRHGYMTNLGTLPGGKGSFAEGIDKKGDVVGSSQTVAGALTHAFLWREGRMRDLGVMDGWPQSEAAAINDRGQIVGNVERLASKSAQKEGHAFLWQRGRMSDLNDLIGPHSGWVLLDAVDINNRGQIVGNGIFEGRHRAFLLTPRRQSRVLLIASRHDRPVETYPRRDPAPVAEISRAQAELKRARVRMVGLQRERRPRNWPVVRVAAYHDLLNKSWRPALSHRPRWISRVSERATHRQLRRPPPIPIGFQGMVVASAHRPYTYTVELGNLSRDIYLGPGRRVRTGDEISVRGVLQKNGVVAAHTMARLGSHYHNLLVTPR